MMPMFSTLWYASSRLRSCCPIGEGDAEDARDGARDEQRRRPSRAAGATKNEQTRGDAVDPHLDEHART